MFHDCIRCGKKYDNKQQFQQHLKGQSGCVVNYIFLPKKKYSDNYSKFNNLFISSYKNLNEVNNDDKQIKYGCEKCGGLYNSRSHHYRHKQVCDPSDNTKICNIDEQKTISGINHSQNKINLQNQSCNTNSPNTNINIHNNITIKNFNGDHDEEILKSIPKRIKTKLLKSPQTAITDLYKLIHIDNPEYRNICIKNPKDGYGMIMHDGDWIPMGMQKLLDEIIEKNSDRLYDIATDDTINVKKIYLCRITDLLDNIVENGSIANNIKRDIKLMTCQFRQLIESTNQQPKPKIHKLKLKEP
jgi:predicted  nucleic acid-binding Zn-ribbon protein